MSPPRNKQKLESDTAEMSLLGRASQKAVDFSLIWRNCGLPGAVFIAVCLTAWYAVPWWGENISKPESQAKISDGHQLAVAFGTFAENQKMEQESQRRREEEARESKAAMQAISEAFINNTAETRKLRQRLEEFLDKK